jgi:putative DNA primase/helicase
MKKEAFVFDEAAPYAGTVQAAELLTEIETIIKKHVLLNPHAAAALAVWVLHTYTFDLRDAVAFVAIESPEKRCGKTTLVSVLAAMVRKERRGGDKEFVVIICTRFLAGMLLRRGQGGLQ